MIYLNFMNYMFRDKSDKKIQNVALRFTDHEALWNSEIN